MLHRRRSRAFPGQACMLFLVPCPHHQQEKAPPSMNRRHMHLTAHTLLTPGQSSDLARFNEINGLAQNMSIPFRKDNFQEHIETLTEYFYGIV